MVEQLVNRGDRATYSGNRRSYYSSKDTPLLDCVPTTGPPSIEWKIGRGGGGVYLQLRETAASNE